jgi:hypothetical protein
MRWSGRGAEGMYAGDDAWSGIWGGRDRARLAVLLLFVSAMALALPSLALACANESFRTGPSASLPDCRAYELVTPEDLGRSQDMTFTRSTDRAIPSSDGEYLALEGATPLEPNPSINGTYAVFSRSAKGWTMKSAVAPGAGNERLEMHLLSPDLSQIALESKTVLDLEESIVSPHSFEIGPVGGPYTTIASIPAEFEAGSELFGANAGTASVPAFSDVLFDSTDHVLLPPGKERMVAEETPGGAPDLYDWTDGTLRLVNIEGEGSQCGAVLGAGSTGQRGNTPGAVSADGSKIIFETEGSGPGCNGPSRLDMRVDGRETVEVSATSPGVKLEPSERQPVRFNVASPDGSEVFFNTGTPLIAGEMPGENKLFMYDTVTRTLTLITEGIADSGGPEGWVVLVSEDGSTVYYDVGGSVYRYETGNGKKRFVAAVGIPANDEHEASYTTPNGDFLVFAAGSEGVKVGPEHELEPRGVGHNDLYRYDAADGSVMCVSCGEGVAPTEGEMFEPSGNALNENMLETEDEIPPLVQMSEDGQQVFFETSAQLVPQDTNITERETSKGIWFPGSDVYEWEADGAGGCALAQGCTDLISSGEDVGPSYFLGASRDGKNVFFSSASQLLPQATPEFSNIYDARVNGGFPAPPSAPECTSCQGVGSQPPLFGPGSSLTFAGAGNPPVSPPPHPIVCAKGRRLSHGRCVKVKVKRKRRAKASATRRAASGRRRRGS